MLDVRTAAEYERGHIPNTVNIPLDKLRTRLDELDKTKPLYVNCQSALRSYVACRILTQHGFDCYNFSGGYRFYASVTKDMEYNPNPAYPCGIEIPAKTK